MITLDDMNIAYKKLKANVYYDKTQLVLRNSIVEYESRYKNLNKLLEDV